MPVASVGDTATATLSVSTTTIDRFADLVGDDNPLHTDDAYANEGIFDGRIAHGMLSASAVSAALANLPGDVVYVSQDIEFVDPVRPGETVRARVEVVEDLGKDRLRVDTAAETDDEVLVGEAIVLSLPHQAPASDECVSEDAPGAGADD